MMGSITPLGERARGRRWSVTVAVFVTASALGGVAIGSVVGAVGSVVASGLGIRARLLAIGAAAAVGVILDAGSMGLRLPSVARQVNEDWMARYRGWVYGAGFGLQLGFGVLTVVTTSALYAALVAALLTGSLAGGLIVGATFGLTRGATILFAARVRRSDQLGRVHTQLRRWDRPARAGAFVAQGAIAVMMAAGAVR